jgi:hypothetical protein
LSVLNFRVGRALLPVKWRRKNGQDCLSFECQQP